RMGAQQRPDRCEKQQTAAMHFVPQACQSCAEQAASLLAGVLADQQDLAECQGDFVFPQRGCLVEQRFAAAQAQSRQGRIDAFGRIAEDVARLVGFAQHLQGERRARLDDLGNFAPGAMVVTQSTAYACMLLLLDWQWQLAQLLYPGV